MLPFRSVNFQKEISNMMHGFSGDPDPEPATVKLIESIVFSQLRFLLQEAYSIANGRGKQCISNYEVIFLMRKNTAKLNQLKEFQLSLEMFEYGIHSSSCDKEWIREFRNKPNSKIRNHIAIIEELDELNEVKSMRFSPYRLERRFRDAVIEVCVPLERYEAFQKARCSSFHSGDSRKKYNKLEKWVNPVNEFKITRLAMEVIGFIAYETVTDLVDNVFKARQDAIRAPDMVFSEIEYLYLFDPMDTPRAIFMKAVYENCPKITNAEVKEVVKRYYKPRVGMDGMFSDDMSQDVPARYIAF